MSWLVIKKFTIIQRCNHTSTMTFSIICFSSNFNWYVCNAIFCKCTFFNKLHVLSSFLIFKIITLYFNYYHVICSFDPWP